MAHRVGQSPHSHWCHSPRHTPHNLLTAHAPPTAVSAQHKLSDYLPFLKTNATLCLVGIPPEPYQLHAGEILMKRLKIGGSIIGGMKETQVFMRGCVFGSQRHRLVCVLGVCVCVCVCMCVCVYVRQNANVDLPSHAHA